jgi:ceramide glucosyltransferase
MFRVAIEIVVAILALSGIAYYFVTLYAVWGFLRRKHPIAATFAPAVSLLKPLRGADPRAYECFRSHCLQEYPEYELIFGVSEADDPAVPLVERLTREFPERRIRLVVCPQALGANRKVSNLIQMLPEARHPVLLINDGDIRVPRDYLRRVVAPLADPAVGLCTALYSGLPGRTLWSRLEALSIVDFVGSVLVAHQFAPKFHYGFGSTLCLRREALDRSGGFESLTDFLADDHQLGTNLVAAGYRVYLSDVIVETTLPDYDLHGFWQHQLRWARTVRDASPRGYAGMLLALGVEWAALAIIISGAAVWSLALFLVAALLRLDAMIAVGLFVTQDDSIWRQVWLVPLRIAQGAAVWVASFFSDTVIWRGEAFILRRGKLIPKTQPGTTAAKEAIQN